MQHSPHCVCDVVANVYSTTLPIDQSAAIGPVQLVRDRYLLVTIAFFFRQFSKSLPCWPTPKNAVSAVRRLGPSSPMTSNGRISFATCTCPTTPLSSVDVAFGVWDRPVVNLLENIYELNINPFRWRSCVARIIASRQSVSMQLNRVCTEFTFNITCRCRIRWQFDVGGRCIVQTNDGQHGTINEMNQNSRTLQTDVETHEWHMQLKRCQRKTTFRFPHN